MVMDRPFRRVANTLLGVLQPGASPRIFEWGGGGPGRIVGRVVNLP